MIMALLIIRQFCSCLFSYFASIFTYPTSPLREKGVSDWFFSLILIL